MRNCAVVGGGMLGMAIALKLARRGFAVTLYESDDRLGGLAAPWSLGPITWDRHYHVILPSDAYLLALLDDLELTNEIVWSSARTNFFIDGAMQPFTTSWDHLRFRALTLAEKVRLAFAVRAIQQCTDWHELERVNVEDWLRASCGDHVFERVWRPLLRSKLGDAYVRCNASFIWATMQRLYVAAKRHGSQRFGYVRGGYRVIVEELARALKTAGVRVVLDTPVEELSRGEQGMHLRTGAGGTDYDLVVVTLPPALAARVCRALTGEERDRLKSIAYQGVVCTSMLLDRPLGNAYITNLADDRVPFTAVIEMTALVDPATFGGRHLVYLPKYCTPHDAFFQASDDAIRISALASLRRMYPSFDASSLLAMRVSRVPNVLPLPVIAYSGHVPGFRTSLPSLYLANSAQIVNATLNVNETLELASRAADVITAHEHERREYDHVFR